MLAARYSTAVRLARRAPARALLSTARAPLILTETCDEGVRTITLNNPTKFNGWNEPMMTAMGAAFDAATADDAVKAVVLTGADPYYCAGVDLASSLRPMMPAALHRMILDSNLRIFNAFLDFPKPLVVAVNGPVLGAACTSATLADAVIASEKATFSTPFARLGVSPEGCSSVHFPYLMGDAAAARMLGDEGWVPTAAEAADAGLVDACVPHGDLAAAAAERARALARDPAYAKSHRGFPDTDALKAVNESESLALASAFLDVPFLQGQVDFLASKGKTRPALVFRLLIATRPAWSKLLP